MKGLGCKSLWQFHCTLYYKGEEKECDVVTITVILLEAKWCLFRDRLLWKCQTENPPPRDHFQVLGHDDVKLQTGPPTPRPSPREAHSKIAWKPSRTFLYSVLDASLAIHESRWLVVNGMSWCPHPLITMRLPCVYGGTTAYHAKQSSSLLSMDGGAICMLPHT